MKLAIVLMLVSCSDEPRHIIFDARPDGTPDARIDAPPPGPGRSCQTALDLTDLAGPMSIATSGGTNFTGSLCGGGGSIGGPDAWGVVHLGATRADLIVDALVDEAPERPFDVVLSARVQCEDAAETACSNAWWSERLEVLGASGTVYLLFDGTPEFGGSVDGAANVSITRRAIVGNTDACDPAGVTSRCGDDQRCQAGVCALTSPAATCAAAPVLSAETSGSLPLYEPDYFQGSCRQVLTNFRAAERVYQVTVTGTGTLVATTDFPETTFDTLLYLRRDACDGADVACNDDVAPAAGNYRARLETPVTPGTYYLFVDASTPYVFGSPVATPRQFRVALSLP